MKIIPEQIFRELILNGVNEFMYLSYDHDAAVEAASAMGATPAPKKWHHLPPQLTNKFPIWKKGKIREMQFNPDGSVKKIFVSKQYPYKKTYYPSQFGIDVKPIIFESDDKYGLIKNDLAYKNEI